MMQNLSLLKVFAMQVEAHWIGIPCEMKEKAFETFRLAFGGVLKEFTMQKKHLKHSANAPR